MTKNWKLIVAGGAAFGLVYLIRSASAGEPNGEIATLLDDPIFFTHDSETIDAESQSRLDRLAVMLTEAGWNQLVITGHTDANGGTSYNQSLGMRRAAAVSGYLNARGMVKPPGATVHTRSAGSSRPLGDNDTALGRAMNRRAEITVE